ncbi:hypothetical protein DFP72DRAFT_1071833 [Ephemerocybe angulata]|uniref:Uncharacterized protein n=1 Tax=Ephemerocybe angulata TaxID=980116 RepID=A0A8H6HPV5_9AGAR|nr:hypothetical protein DFP72DRAFT_1071833 [Tulosesus angulatus]
MQQALADTGKLDGCRKEQEDNRTGGIRREIGAEGGEGFSDVRSSTRRMPHVEPDPEIVAAVNVSTFWPLFQEELWTTISQQGDQVTHGALDAAFERAWDRQRRIPGGHDIRRQFIRPLRSVIIASLRTMLATPSIYIMLDLSSRYKSIVEISITVARDAVVKRMDKFARQQARTSETTIAIPPALPSAASPAVPPAASPAAPPAAPPVAPPALASMAEPLLDAQLPCQLTPPSDADSTEPDSSFRPPVIFFHPSSPANPLPGFILHPTFPNLEPEPRKVEPHFRTPAQQQSFQRTATIGLGDDDSDSDSGRRPARHDGEVFAPSEMFYRIDEHTAEQWAPDHHRPPESPENQHQDLEEEESSGYDYGPEVGIHNMRGDHLDYVSYGSGHQEGYMEGYDDGYEGGYDVGYGMGYGDGYYDSHSEENGSSEEERSDEGCHDEGYYDGYSEDERSSGDEEYPDDAASDEESEGVDDRSESDYQSDTESDWGE